MFVEHDDLFVIAVTFVRRTFIASGWANIFHFHPFSATLIRFWGIWSAGITGAAVKIWIEFLASKPGTWRLHVGVFLLQCFCAVLRNSKYSILASCSNLASKRLMRHNSIPSPFYPSVRVAIVVLQGVWESSCISTWEETLKFRGVWPAWRDFSCACLDVSNWRQRRGFGDQVAGFPLCQQVLHSFSKLLGTSRVQV